MDIFQVFVERFNKNDDAKPIDQLDIDRIENEFAVNLPKDYKDFIKRFGETWTPNILDIIVDSEQDLNDIQQIWAIDQIINDKKNEWTSQLIVDIIPFANDCTGNIFGFKTSDLNKTNENSPVYFYDHDFDTVEKISESFTKLIENYNKL